jgi:hypothetical protein
VKDALIVAPPAVGRFGLSSPTYHAPSPLELVELLSARVRELERAFTELETTTGMIANAALSLAYVALQRDARPVSDGLVIAGEVTREMEGARLILGEHDGDLVVRIGER